jgi:hypothetical protein
LFGHPQIYCGVITHILLELQCRVFLIAGWSEGIGINESPDIKPLLNDDRVTVIECGRISSTKDRFLSAEEITRIQKDFHIDSTLFIDADYFRNEFVRINKGAAPRLMGKNVGIFNQTSVWYPGEDFYSGEKIKWYAPTIRGSLGKIKRAIFRRKETDRYFYEEIIIRKRGLDAVLVKDERVSEHFGPPVFWMPDIYRSFDIAEGTVGDQEYDEFSGKYQEFLSRQNGREVLLFFGKGAWYRGYDYFLQLLEMDSTSCGVHCGAEYVKDGPEYEFDVVRLRKGLSLEGRLFETQQYIHSKKLIDLFYSTTQKAVSTNRLTGSSGTMLQALEAGLPVLAPDRGLLGYRVKSNRLGEIYKYRDIEDLYGKWMLFKSQPVSQYRGSIERFVKQFDRKSLIESFRNLLMT